MGADSLNSTSLADPTRKRLKIVVPYRDRAAHLAQFLPHIREYLRDEGIAYTIVIAEQDEGLPFNRGAMKIVGFLAAGPSDYTCFHYVDYLPLRVDYGWTDEPACLVLSGTQNLAVKMDDPSQPIHLDMSNFFGGAVLVPDALFRQVDGYANGYWGWGYVDSDLLDRFAAMGISCIRRPGSFIPLLHDSHGYEADGSLNRDAGMNRLRYRSAWRDGQPVKIDGLSTLQYEVSSREALDEGDGEHITVRLFQTS